jgi:hypothetical protein
VKPNPAPMQELLPTVLNGFLIRFSDSHIYGMRAGSKRLPADRVMAVPSKPGRPGRLSKQKKGFITEDALAFSFAL